MEKQTSGTTILITGAGGSIGSALAKALLGLGPNHLVLVDHSEGNLHEIVSELSITSGVSYSAVVGDVCDVKLMEELVEKHRPGIVYHAAAFKHVPLMETNPFAAVRNNALGTASLARVCEAHGVPTLVMVSTDKAVNPASIMGASKRIAELALLNSTSLRSRMSAVRLGNVLGSHGSVVATFAAQIKRGGPVTVTHPDISRYFLTIGEAVELIVLVSRFNKDGGIFVPRLNAPVKIVEIAREMIGAAQSDSSHDVPVVFTGLRPGDKMSEEFLFENEFAEPTSDPRLLQVNVPEILTSGFDRHMQNLVTSVEERNLTSMIAAIRQVVPTYRPTELLDHSKKGSLV